MEENNEGRKQLNSHEPDPTLRNICPDPLQFRAALLTNDSNGLIGTDTWREYNNALSLSVSGACSASKTYQDRRRKAPQRTNPDPEPFPGESQSKPRSWPRLYVMCNILSTPQNHKTYFNGYHVTTLWPVQPIWPRSGGFLRSNS